MGDPFHFEEDIEVSVLGTSDLSILMKFCKDVVFDEQNPNILEKIETDNIILFKKPFSGLGSSDV